MGLIKEPLSVDFIVESRPLTRAEEKAISEFIKADKGKRLARNKKLLLEKQKEQKRLND